MRLILARALTVALAIVGGAGAMAFPKLVLDDAVPEQEAPTFAVPAPKPVPVIRLAPVAPTGPEGGRAAPHRPAAPKPAAPKPAAPPVRSVPRTTVVSARPTPVAVAHAPAAPPVASSPRSASIPPAAAAPTPSPAPAPAPIPESVAEPVVRTLAAVTDDGKKDKKAKKGERAKSAKKDKEKRDKHETPVEPPVTTEVEAAVAGQPPSLDGEGEGSDNGHGHGKDKQKDKND